MTLFDFTQWKTRHSTESVAFVAALRRDVSPILAKAIADMLDAGHTLREVRSHLRKLIACSEAAA